MSLGYISQIEVVPAVNGEDVVIFFEISAKQENPFGGASTTTHRASLNADEVSPEIREAAKLIYDACTASVDNKMPVINGVKATLEVTDFEATVADLKAKRSEKGE